MANAGIDRRRGIVVAELVTNAGKPGKVFKLTLRRPKPGTLRIEVKDRSSDVPVPADPLADLDNDDCDAKRRAWSRPGRRSFRRMGL